MIMQLTDINAFQEYKGINKGRWVLYNKVTGKNLKFVGPWDTEEEARAAIPAAHANYQRQVQKYKTEQAKQEAEREQHQAKHSRGYDNRGSYRTRSDGGRVYDNLPGAVHYDATGNGHYGTQIWDEA